MQLTNVLIAFGLVAAVSANPLEARNKWHDAKKCDWQCPKWYPKCNNEWYPKCCKGGWGDENCGDWGEYARVLPTCY